MLHPTDSLRLEFASKLAAFRTNAAMAASPALCSAHSNLNPAVILEDSSESMSDAWADFRLNDKKSQGLAPALTIYSVSLGPNGVPADHLWTRQHLEPGRLWGSAVQTKRRHDTKLYITCLHTPKPGFIWLCLALNSPHLSLVTRACGR